MDYTRIMIKGMLENHKNDKINFRYSLDIALEYYKWLNYIPSFELKKIEPLLIKKASDFLAFSIFLPLLYKGIST